MAEMKKYYCEICNQTINEDNFYTSNNLDKYPDGGKLHQCKKCITRHVDNWDPDTYLWILKEIDVPYVPEVWDRLLARWGKDKSKVTGMSILGRYLSTMKIKQYKDFRWEDTENLNNLAEKRLKETMERQGYSAGQIALALDEKKSVDVSNVTEPKDESLLNEFAAAPPPPAFETSSAEDLGLTEEDISFLRIKWGSMYKPEEWIKLEQLYEEMMDSYDIQTAGHIDTLKLVCKTSLKANQLLDIGDVDGAQKMLKMYDQLMKSGKFQASQNKAENGEYVDSVSELVMICETQGFIPRYYVDGPQDKVDRVLQDLQGYTRTLVTEEMNLGNMIENALKQIELDKENEANNDSEAADDDEILENSLFADSPEITDEDFKDFYDLEDQWEEETNAAIDEEAF